MKHWAIVGAGLLLAALVLGLGRGGGFQFDDIPNIVDAPYLHVTSPNPASLAAAAAEGRSGALGRPVSLVSFALSHALNGLDPAAFKVFNIVLHLLNGLLCFQLARLLLRIDQGLSPPNADHPKLAAIVALAWVLHPLQISSVLYVVQRMNELSALFSLAACILYVKGRMQLLDGRAIGFLGIGLSLTVLPAAATLSKENGALTPAYLLLIEACFFRLACPSPQLRRGLLLALAMLALAPIAAAGVYSMVQPQWFLDGYLSRDFTLRERLLTEARAMWLYIALILLPVPGYMGLFHDDFALSTSLLNPYTTLAAVIALPGLLVAGVHWARRRQLLGFGVLFFVLGHSLESTVIALEPVYEHRNYLPMFGLILGGLAFAARASHAAFPYKVRAVAAGALIAGLALLTALRAASWSDPRRWLETEVRNHPRSARAQHDLAAILDRAGATATSAGARRALREKAAGHAAQAAALRPQSSEHMLLFLLIQAGLEQYPKESFWDELDQRLAQGVISASAVSSFQGLVQCQIEQACPFAAARVQRSLMLAARSPAIRPADRAILLHTAGVHAFWMNLDRTGGIQLMAEALRQDPQHLRLRTSYIRALSLVGDEASAAAQLAEARRLDTRGAFAQEWQRLEAEIQPQASSSDKLLGK